MVTVSRIEAGRYAVSDGRLIIKDGSNWFIISNDGKQYFGPVTTLAAAKEFVETGTLPIGQHNGGSAYGRRQSKKELNAYMAAEAKRGNFGPLIIYMLLIGGVLLLFFIIEKH